MRKNIRMSLIAGAPLFAFMTACGVSVPMDEGVDTADPTARASATETTTAAEETETPVVSPSPAQTIFAFGETSSCSDPDAPYTFVIAAPIEYDPSEYYDDQIVGTPLKFGVTVANTGNNVLDASLIYLTASSGGAESLSQFDSEAGVSGAPTTPLLPGQSTTFAYAFDVADPNDIVVQVSGISMACNAAIYTNVPLG